MKKERWTDSQIATLKEKYETTPSIELKALLNKSGIAIKHKARRIGLRRPSNFKTRCVLSGLKKRKFRNSNFPHFICGFVAGEGSFVINKYKTRKRFSFTIALADDDAPILEDFRGFFGVGNIFKYPPRRKNWKGSISYTVEDYNSLLGIIIPFFDTFGLNNTRKQNQYDSWKKELVHYILTRK